jgi:hypothetical protein
LSEESENDMPPAGAGPDAVTVATVDEPELIEDGLKAIADRAGGLSWNVPDTFEPRAEQVIVTVIGADTAVVVALNGVQEKLAAIVTLGVGFTEGLELVIETFRPLLGAAPLMKTIPSMGVPPTTLAEPKRTLSKSG